VPELIATVMADSTAGVGWRVRRAAMAGADWIELRFDRWPRGDDLGELVATVDLPVIATCRVPRDGGFFDGPRDDRRELLQRAIDAGAAGVDLEDWESWQPRPGPRLRLVIRSAHGLTGLPRDLHEVRERLFAMGGQVAKLAFAVPDLADAAPLLELLSATDHGREPTVAFALGRAAWPTRVLAGLLGSPFVYGSFGEDEAGVGQPPVGVLSGLYSARTLSTATAIYGVLGNPAFHSAGPWLHNRVFRRLGLDAVYLPLETARAEAVVAMLPRRRRRGLSVTAPFKQLARRMCHELDPAAAATGVVNTIVFEAHGHVRGCNTDVAGVHGALRRAGLDGAAGARAVVWGGGGAARAAVVALQDMGFSVVIMTRSLDAVRAFARDRGAQVASLSTDVMVQLRPRVVVHATPVGTEGSPTEGQRLLPDYEHPPGTVVLDMVYRPEVTPLLAAAAASGATPVSGLEMFLTQAREQVRLFTGEQLVEDELRAFMS
jgi:3-dehydroquinate dehydratase/shikimate dehydrogenase